MPNYDYKCEKCGHVFEAQHSHKDRPLTACPSNGCQGKVRRLFSAPAIVFRGKGFHTTDYGKRTTKAAPTSAAPSSCPQSDTCKSGSCPAATGD